MIRLQNAILEMIAKGDSLAVTAMRLCEEVERLTPGAICSVCTVDQGRLHSLAAPSLPASYALGVEGMPIGLRQDPAEPPHSWART